MQLPALDSAAWVESLGTFLKGFADVHLEVQEAVADEGMTAQRILFSGNHTGPFRGLPPTGREVRFSGIEINRTAGGKVTTATGEQTRSSRNSRLRRLGLTEARRLI
jgi:predicted ester cyclase